MGKYKEIVKSIIEEKFNFEKGGKRMTFKKDADGDGKAELAKHKSHKDLKDDDPDNDKVEEDFVRDGTGPKGKGKGPGKGKGDCKKK